MGTYPDKYIDPMRKYNAESFANIKLVLEDYTLDHRCSKISNKAMIKAGVIKESREPTEKNLGGIRDEDVNSVNYHTIFNNDYHLALLRSPKRGLERLAKNGHTNSNIIVCETEDDI